MFSIPLILSMSIHVSSAEADASFKRASALIANKSRVSNRYAIELRVESRILNAPPLLESEWNATIKIWRDGNRIRVDHFDAHYTPSRPRHDSKDRRITCENCEREGYGIVTTILPQSHIIQPLVEFRRMGQHNFDGYCTGFDWRFFGLSNDRMCGYARLRIANDFPEFFSRPDLATKRDMRDGRECMVVSRKVKNTEWAVWLSEHDEFHPLLFEEKFEVKGEPERRTTEISWQRIAGGHIFPKRMKHNSMIKTNGQSYPLEEVVSVIHANFESSIDPTVFTLAGFGLNENQVIGYPELEHKDQPRWKNGKVDWSETAGKQPEGGSAAPVAPAPYPAESNLSSIIGSIAAVLAVVAAAAAFIVRRRRAST